MMLPPMVLQLVPCIRTAVWQVRIAVLLCTLAVLAQPVAAHPAKEHAKDGAVLLSMALTTVNTPAEQIALALQSDQQLRSTKTEILQEVANLADIATSVEMGDWLEQQQALRQELRAMRAEPMPDVAAIADIRHQLREARDNIDILANFASLQPDTEVGRLEGAGE